MKILVASHTYIVDLNCDKLRMLVHCDSNIEVKIIVPQYWQPGGVQKNRIKTKRWGEGNFEVIPVSNFSENNQGLLTFGLDIIPILKSFKPDIIQVEQGVKSFAYAQLITLNNWLNLKAKNVFFTWWNLPYQNKFPVSWLEKYNLKYTDGLIGGNQDAVDILREHGYQGKAIVMPQLGVDEQLFSKQEQPELKRQLGIHPEDFVIGFVGRFVPEKGILTLLEAVGKLEKSKIRVLLLGRGELKDKIVQFANDLELLPKLIILDSVPHHQVPRYLNLMDTLVLPSQTSYRFKTLTSVGWKEQFGHVLIEAMACRIPVIGSDSGEIPHVIGEGGLIFPEGDVQALKNALITLMEDSNLRKSIAGKGFDRTITHYSNQALARNLLNFYHEILNQ